ncbi:phosphodiester glycosidase family protein [Pseudooceanicola sp. 200-1SW]|uniref:phosphodiester glycosidase family protein n=1 Tax=Pseudooceanicola sp. 200-1SW TaxID=3425949 RepID=UPI003D7FA539
MPARRLRTPLLPALAVLLLVLLAWPLAAGAVSCRNQDWGGNRFAVCEVDPATEALRLFLYDPGGAPYGDFTTLEARLQSRGQRLAFAMNAGMYHEDRAPVGHYVEDGQEAMRVIPNAGPGNFGLLPNGVFCIASDRALVVETLDYQRRRDRLGCRDVTQSGPMLVIDGELHPRFLPDSSSRYIRNGVGTTASGDRAVFVISRNAVTLHDFASFFRDALELPQALYLDGNVSRLYAPELGRADWGRPMGPIVAVVE